MSSRISTLESRPTGVRSEFLGGNPNPVGAQPAFAGGPAPGADPQSQSQQRWSADDRARWRSGT
eukprot:15459696-Alexandrium_andersonii.AAC.1